MNNKPMTHLLVSALVVACASAALADDTHTLAAPDGKLVLKLHHTAEPGLTYALEADGRTLIEPSPITSTSKPAAHSRAEPRAASK